MGLLRDADGAIHTASPGDATSAKLDRAVVDAAIEAFAGTDKPYIHISGLWIYGNNPSISEESPIDAPVLVAWKEPIERRVVSERHARASSSRPAPPTATAAEALPASSSVHHETTMET